jgi:hypothetical protein
MDLDTLIRDADRAPNTTIPTGDTAAARCLHDRLVAKKRRGQRYRLSLGGVLSVAGVAAIITVLASPGSSPLTPASAAAAVLRHAANAVQDQQPLELSPGQYLYTEIETLGLPSGFESGEGNEPFVLYPTTIQSWTGADGSSRRAETVGGAPQFPTPQAEQAWIEAGQPTPTDEFNAWAREHDETFPANSVQTPQDYSHLPTDPAALRAAIESGATGVTVPDLSPLPASSPTAVFAIAAQLLATPGEGAQPGLAAALYNVMASLPGIENLGQATDHTGRTGIAIALPGRFALREIIVDPADGAMLEQSQVLTNPATEPPIFKTEFGDTPGETLSWTDYLNSGVVNSTSVTPNSGGATGATDAS